MSIFGAKNIKLSDFSDFPQFDCHIKDNSNLSTTYLLGLSSIPAVSMDRWRSPSDNRYARNAGVSIRYKK